MKLKSTFCSILFTLITINFSFCQETDIRFHVSAINEITGNNVTDCEFIVNVEPSGFGIPLTTTKKETFYKILPNTRFKVTAIAKGFYKEEEFFESSDLNDDETLKLKLNPKKGNQAIIRVIDAISRKNIEAQVEITEAEMQIKENLTAKKDFVSLNFDDSKNIYIKVTAKDYTEIVKSVALNINGSIKENTFDIEMTKNMHLANVVFLDKDNKALNSVNFEIIRDNKTTRFEKGVTKENKLSIGAELNANITVNYSLAGYVPGKATVLANDREHKINLDKISGIEISIIDSATNTKLVSNIEILKNNKRVAVLEEKNGIYQFMPTNAGIYNLNVTLLGYEPHFRNIDISDLSKIPNQILIKLKRIKEKYIVKVFDSQTQAALNTAKIKITDNLSNPHESQQKNNEFTLVLPSEMKYTYLVSNEGYTDKTGNFDKEKIINVYLEKIKEAILPMYFYALDSKSLEIIPARRFKLFDKNKKELTYKKEGERYILENYPKNEVIYYEVSVDGFRDQIGDRIPGVNNAVQFDPSELVNYTVSVVDTILNKPVDFTFKINQANKDVAITNKSFRMDKQINDYSIKIEANGYKNISEKLNRDKAKNTEFIYRVAKPNYEVTFKFDTILVAENLEKSKVALITKDDSYVQKVNLAINGFKSKINSGEKYKLESILKGFENVAQDFSIANVKLPEMEYIIHLTAIKKPVVIVPPVTPKPEIIKVEEKPKETPVIVQKPVVKVEPPKAEQPKIEEPTDLPSMATSITKGKKYRLNGVNFERGKAVLIKGSEGQLKTLADALAANKNLRIEIIGYTDNEDKDERLNQRLSLFRAKLVSNYLFNHGIAEQRIEAVGMGSANPLAANDTEENKAKNRRVEVMIVEN